MLKRRIAEVWPDSVHLLGREHLIKNFLSNGRKQRVPEKELQAMKRDLFGPSRDMSLPLLEELDDDWSSHAEAMHVKWLRNGSEHGCRFAEWVKVSYLFL